MSNISRRDGFNYRGKSDILLPALKGGGVIAGGLFAFNFLVDKPVIGDVLVAYRKTMHRFFRAISGRHFTDRHLLDAGALSFLDGLTFVGVALFAGLFGAGKGGRKTPTQLDDLAPDGRQK